MRFQAVRGTRDILPGEAEIWQRVEKLAREILERYGFREIRTPIFETTELFARGVGGSTDIVRKEMFTFRSGDDSLTLRPEMTASVVRAYIQHGLSRVPGAERLYYIGPMFRRERPQKGRQRQFHQLGVEVFGSEDPYVDAETIAMLMSFLRALEVRGLRLILNSVGCNNEDCRPRYRAVLRRWLENELPHLCEDCHRRFEENPLRVFDCKVEADQRRILLAPTPKGPDPSHPSGTYRCVECEEHFASVRRNLERLGHGFQEPGGYWIDDRLVRGLDYYVRTAFEIQAESGLGSQNALMGGGRYDGLVKDLEGPDVPAFGWALGLERLMLLLGVSFEDGARSMKTRSDLFLAHLGDEAWVRAIPLAQALRDRGISVRVDPRAKGLGAQLKRAVREGARFTLILGDDEIRSGTYSLKDMAAETQETIEAGEGPGLVEALVRRLEARGPA